MDLVATIVTPTYPASYATLLTIPAARLASDLAAVHGPALTGWTEGLARPPSLAVVARAGSEAPTTKVVSNVSVASPVSPVRGNALR